MLLFYLFIYLFSGNVNVLKETKNRSVNNMTKEYRPYTKMVVVVQISPSYLPRSLAQKSKELLP